MGGLGEVDFSMGEIGGIPLPFIEVNTDFPSVACLGAQKAGWTVKVGNYFAMGSGPARALSLKPKHTYEVIGYEDDFDSAVDLPRVRPPAERRGDGEDRERMSRRRRQRLRRGGADGLDRRLDPGLRPLCRDRDLQTERTRLRHDQDHGRHRNGTVPPVKKDATQAMGTTNDATIYHGRIS